MILWDFWLSSKLVTQLPEAVQALHLANPDEMSHKIDASEK
jgi:hypothetical protein